MRFSLAVLALSGLYAFALGTSMPARAMQDSPKTTWDGAYTADQAKRGEALFSQSCSSCHGADLKGADAPSLTGSDFNTGWNTMTLDDLFERVRTTMPADGPGSLQRQQYADIIAFILSKDGFPAGQTEVSTENPVLKNVKIVVQKP